MGSTYIANVDWGTSYMSNGDCIVFSRGISANSIVCDKTGAGGALGSNGGTLKCIGIGISRSIFVIVVFVYVYVRDL